MVREKQFDGQNNGMRIGINFMSFKATKKTFKIPKDLSSLVIYQYTYTYIGKTKRHLKTRIHEYMDESVITRKLISTSLNSAIGDHAHEAARPMNCDNFSIRDSERNDTELFLLKSIGNIKR